MTTILAGAFRRIWRDETAATAIEYAVLAAGIALAILLTVYAVRDVLMANYYDRLANEAFK